MSDNPRFLQIHTLTGYAASLLNRDDVGAAKRLPFGGAERTRISSQCLKRHLRMDTGDWSLKTLGAPMSIRSRLIFRTRVAQPLVDEGRDPASVVAVVEPLMAVLLGRSDKAEKEDKGSRGKAKAAAEGADPLDRLETDQLIVLGQPEIDFVRKTAGDLLAQGGDVAEVRERVSVFLKDRKAMENIKSLARACGLDAAMFGRMVTSDMLARGDAAVHVAHAFTVHRQESEPDYFTAVDDLQLETGEQGSAHINQTELTSGLFYGYYVIDLAKLIENLGGDGDLAGNVVQRFVHLVSSVSPGAKLGSTAPYSYADLLMIESGRRQPRSLANAFHTPVPAEGVRIKALGALGQHLAHFDAMYGPPEARRVAAMEDTAAVLGQRMPLAALSDWALAEAKRAA